MLFVSPSVHSVGQCRNLSLSLPAISCLPPTGVPNRQHRELLTLEVAMLVMRKQLNCFVLLASPYLPLFTCVNVRLTLCACIVKHTSVHPWKMFIRLQTTEYLQCDNAAFSTTDMLLYILWVWSNGFLSKAHLTTFSTCCLDCVDCMLLVLLQYLPSYDTFLATVSCLICCFPK